jgi:PAS domain S-box-containing protein
MRFSSASLGLKLNLSLVFFLLMLVAATGGVILYGFSRTRDNATERSREGLEELSKQQVMTIATDQADLGAYQLEWAADAGQMAAKYLVDIRRSGAAAPFDPSRLARTEAGVLYDPDPSRATDIALPNFVQLTPAALQDLRDSSVFDTLFPAMKATYPGQLRAESFDAIAITYSTVNQVTRYYPPIGIQDFAAPDTDMTPKLQDAGPEWNRLRHTVWTVPYLDRVGQGLVITANTPVYDGDTYLGVIGIDLSINRLVTTIDQVPPTSNGFAFYMDRNGDLLRGRGYDTIVSELDSGNADLKAVMDAMKRNERSVARITINGEDMFIGYSPISGVGGSFAVAASVDEMTAQAAAITASIDEQADNTLTFMLLAMAGLFAIGLGGATWMNRHFIVKPIEALVDGTRKVARGDLETTIPVRSEDEFGILATSFNTMTGEMRSRSEALRREIKERTQAQEELRALFAAMTDRVIVLDREGRYLRIAQTGENMLLEPEEEIVGRRMQDIRPPEISAQIIDTVRQALDEHQTRTVQFPAETQAGRRWLSGAYSPLTEDTVVGVVRDITEIVEARREAEEQRDALQAAQDELRALFAAMTDFVVVIDKDGRYLRVPQTNSANALMDQQVLPGKTLWEVMPRQQADAFMIPIREALEARRTVTKEYPFDVNGETRWLSAAVSPISDEAVLVVARDITDRILAGQELERLVRERTRELRTLLDVSRNVVGTLDLSQLMQVIMEQVEEVCPYSRASLYLYDQDSMAIVATRIPGGDFTTMPPSFRIPMERIAGIWKTIGSDEPAIIDDVHGPSELAIGLREAVGAPVTESATQGLSSWMGIPLLLKDRIVGMLALTHAEKAFFKPHQYELVRAIANQAAVAIENAKLYEQAQQLAAVEERQKLARELHDSVSQALYGIALGARTARTQLDRDPSRAVEPVEYVLQLAEAGLAEMRALIFELRPESLEIEGLVAALEKHVAATTARYGIKVTGEFGSEPDLSLGGKEVFYRVAQEALHNVVKHSRAATASVRLVNNGDLTLEVRDDGVGFDAKQSFPGHMGLVSMNERAATIGAHVEVESQPGEGTTVRLVLPRS